MVCGTYQAPLMGACPRCLGIKAEDTGKFKEGTRKGNPLASFCFSVSGIKEQSKYWNSHTLTWQTQKSVYGSVKSGLFIWEIGGFLYKSEIGGLERGANCWGGRVFSVCGGNVCTTSEIRVCWGLWRGHSPSSLDDASEEPQPALLPLLLSLPFWDD